MLHDISVIANHVERYSVVILIHESQFEVTRYRAVKDSETILSSGYIKEWLVLPIREELVSHESVRVERIKPKLTLLVPSFVSDHEVDVIIAISPVQ